MALALVRFLRISPLTHVHTFQGVADSCFDVTSEAEKSLNVNANGPYLPQLSSDLFL